MLGVSWPALTLGLGAALLTAAALLLAPSPARAVDECGAQSSGNTLTCSGTTYSDGVFYGGINQLSSSKTVNVVGSASGTTITAGSSQAAGVYVATASASGNIMVNIGGETSGTAHVVNIVQGSNTNNNADRNSGVYIRNRFQFGTTDIDVKAGVTIGTASTAMKNHGIHMLLNAPAAAGRANYAATLTNAAPIFARRAGIRFERLNGGPQTHPTVITNSGAISAGVGNTGETVNPGSPHDAPHGISMLVGGTAHSGAMTITNSGDITLSNGPYTGIFLNYWGGGNVTATNSGAINAPGGTGVNLDLNGANVDAISFTNSGNIDAATLGIRFARDGASIGTTMFENSGDITVTGDAGTNVGHAILLPNAGATGDFTIENSGVLRSKNHALFATMTNTAIASALTLENTGSATSENGDGIRVERVGTGSLTITSGATSSTVSGGAFGLYASHSGTAGTVSVTHSAGTVMGRTGILAEVTRASAQSATRATNQPLLDVEWTDGTFTQGTRSDTGRFAAATPWRVIALDRESAAQKAVAESVRYGAAAGIEARVLDWDAVVTAVAAGDDPGAFANLAAQQAAVPTGATAADNAYVAQFRAALENDELAVGSVVLTAIGTTATTSVDDITDAQIVAWLRTDNAGRRTLLRNILRHGLSEKEKAVLRAVVTNEGLTAALDDTAAAFSTTYKTAVNNLLNSRHLDDIRVAVNGGSITSRGDGIRAYYVTPNDNNGGIDVTIAAGTTVTGGASGVYVANGGRTLTVKRKYRADWMMSENGEDDVAASYVTVVGGTTTTTNLRNQLVTVHGRVTGGTDAAVRLSGGGGVLVMENAEVHARGASGDSGVGILAQNGPALVYVDGEVKGADGGEAAVHLKDGGSVALGLNGKVLANGADHAIKGSDTANTPTAVTVAIESALQHKEDVTERIAGSLDNVANVVFRVYDAMGAPTSTTTTGVIMANGMLDVSMFPWKPVQLQLSDLTTAALACPTTGRCVVPSQAGTISGRTGVHAVVPSASGMSDMRATQPLIDVTWTGTFAHAVGDNDNGRFTAVNPVQVVAFDQAAAAQQTVRYDRAAGIEARLLSWREAVSVVAAGDDPGTVANNAAQLTAVPTTATATNNDYVKYFKAALENGEITVDAALLTAIGTTATTSVADITDAQIVTYLRTDDAGIRPLLQNILAQGLSEKEQAVLRAVAAGDTTALDTALEDADAAFSASYKTAVKALLDRYHLDDIRVAVNGGSIDSRGDGIRAYYATPHANNGGIAVTIAAGTTVSGDVAGVYVANAGDDLSVSVAGSVSGAMEGIYARNAGEDISVSLAAGASVTGGTDGIHAANAGDDDDISVSLATGASVTGGTDGIRATNAGGISVTIAAGATVTGAAAGIHVADAGEGLMLARKYTPAWQQDQSQNGEDIVAAEYVTVASGVTTTTPLVNQLVTVHGTVTGGTDAAVHLSGGGALIVGATGRVLAGSSGRAILVNDPGPAFIHVAGTVQGGTGAGAAVELTGGGSVTVAGMVQSGTGAGASAVHLTSGGSVTVASGGMITGGTQVGISGVTAGVQVVNRGTISGQTGIQVPAASTVENYGTILGTGQNPILIDFQGTGMSVVNMYAGSQATGIIRLDGQGGDVVDASRATIGDVALTFQDETGNRATPNFMAPTVTRPTPTPDPGTDPDPDPDPMGPTDPTDPTRPTDPTQPTGPTGLIEPMRGRPGEILLRGPSGVMGLDISGLALTDDVLSDLTGSIHGAVMETQTGMRPVTASAGQVWATPFGGARNQNGRGDVAGATHYFGGGIVGTSWGAQALRVGGFIGGSVGRLDTDNTAGQNPDEEVQTIFGGVVASRASDNILYDARLLVGHITHDFTRRVPGMDTAEGEYTSVFFSPEVGVAATLKLTDTLNAMPRLRVRYAGMVTEAFQERGKLTIWDVQYAERTLHVAEVRAEVGVPVTLANGGRIHPRVGLEGRWLLAGSEIKGTFLGGNPFNVDTRGDDAVITGTAGVGVSVPVAEGTMLVGSFDGALTTEQAWRALGYLGLTYAF